MTEKELREKVKELLEVGKPFKKVVKHLDPRKSDHKILLTSTERVSDTGIYVHHIRIGNIRRLVETLEEIEDE